MPNVHSLFTSIQQGSCAQERDLKRYIKDGSTHKALRKLFTSLMVQTLYLCSPWKGCSTLTLRATSHISWLKQ